MKRGCECFVPCVKDGWIDGILLVKYLMRLKIVRKLINANDKILNIYPALNGPKIINAVLINTRQAIRVNNMASYFCVIRYIDLSRISKILGISLAKRHHVEAG